MLCKPSNLTMNNKEYHQNNCQKSICKSSINDFTNFNHWLEYANYDNKPSIKHTKIVVLLLWYCREIASFWTNKNELAPQPESHTWVTTPMLMADACILINLKRSWTSTISSWSLRIKTCNGDTRENHYQTKPEITHYSKRKGNWTLIKMEEKSSKVKHI